MANLAVTAYCWVLGIMRPQFAVITVHNVFITSHTALLTKHFGYRIADTYTSPAMCLRYGLGYSNNRI